MRIFGAYRVGLSGMYDLEEKNRQLHVRSKVHPIIESFKGKPGSCTCHFQSHPIGQNLVTCSYLAARKAGNVCVLGGRLASLNSKVYYYEKRKMCIEG